MELHIKNLKPEQAKRMKKHLSIEHPITRGKMELEDREGECKNNYKKGDYCDLIY